MLSLYVAVEVNTVICLGRVNIDLLSEIRNEARYLRRPLKKSNVMRLISDPTRVTTLLPFETTWTHGRCYVDVNHQCQKRGPK
ncbi:hypothetical protein J6590_049147 [Homalodisca vitripennis]|nr:hypothetical protein J6590_049147 [Homalodisca vitripennis]